MNRYCALLRGINVGGNNIIKMIDLKRSFENNGFKNVETYIQSGNVIFSSDEKNMENLTLQIEEKLSKDFSYQSKIILLNEAFLKRVVENIPEGFGVEPDLYRYDVLFPKLPLTSSEVLTVLTCKDGVDSAIDKNEVIYFSRFGEKSSQSQLSKFVTSTLYKQVTIRNWNTTKKLANMM
jgi:uncharacterized protein (DUF1697 family)